MQYEILLRFERAELLVYWENGEWNGCILCFIKYFLVKIRFLCG